MAASATYRRRVIDDELDELIGALAAIAIEGPKGVGKTRTALQRAKTVHRLDDPAELAVAQAQPARLLEGERPVLIDEWQRLTEVWDLVRRAVDDGDGKHLRWLKEKLGDMVLDQVIVTTGPQAYRRSDGVAVVPLALLGP